MDAIERRKFRNYQNLLDLMEMVDEDPNYLDRVVDLLNMGIDVNYHPNGRRSPLEMAMIWNHQELMRILLEAGADPNDQDRDGNSLLHKAVHGRHPNPELIALLVNYGGDPNLTNNLGQTAYNLVFTNFLNINNVDHVIAILDSYQEPLKEPDPDLY